MQICHIYNKNCHFDCVIFRVYVNLCVKFKQNICFCVKQHHCPLNLQLYDVDSFLFHSVILIHYPIYTIFKKEPKI